MVVKKNPAGLFMFRMRCVCRELLIRSKEFLNKFHWFHEKCNQNQERFLSEHIVEIDASNEIKSDLCVLAVVHPRRCRH